ncbi:hypothetical protein BX616_004821 [Lobosporangium transversale]|uniref:UspA domain-containing protein n=1 Tax=Lobosporangium transversale TaxID=64571 RepID=A0A1Y2GCB3_9FUNG|nr:hypothetical protein BCR41DRAFT_425039 [Lobosporangium transversale]KAF9918869.1 hypothetical protein BX616_004821 [Lobosporangium transversale]ORZ06804.1 hypothetical protein BCR41DRAFT_425039 [Lobosporangium transversale]|eukprot:XP_021877725.1 hypothetical protein BCR41DRAFT_425039 [Lobosporangium transversale]
MSAKDLAISTTQSAPADAEGEEPSQAMPLSPASVRSYQKKKLSKGRGEPSKEPDLFSEEESDSGSDDKFQESDKKAEDDEDEDHFKHLDPRLEALDGTIKLKSASEKKKDKEQDNDDDEEQEDDSIEDDDSETTASSNPLAQGMANMELGGATTASTVSGTPVSQSQPKISQSNMEEGSEANQDSMSTGTDTIASADSITPSQLERLQEPIKPHIALPCLVETAKNPARTRITLKYAGKDHGTDSNSIMEEQDQKRSTRGRKNYMVATDLSGESWHATEWTITTILRNGDEMNVVTIVEDEKNDNNKGVKKGIQIEMREDAEKLTKNIHEQLEHTCLRDITVVIHIVAATKSMGAKELLIEMIDDLEDLSTVIVGSRGRGAIKGLLLGSISNFLVHNSSVPVMVVRAPKKSKGKKKSRRSHIPEQLRSVKEANLKYQQAFADDC